MCWYDRTRELVCVNAKLRAVVDVGDMEQGGTAIQGTVDTEGVDVGR